MRATQLFFPTLREIPSEAEMINHKLLLRAGYIRKVAAGIYDYLPLGYKLIRKIETIVRKEMEDAGAQEILMPTMVPAELYKETGRWDLDVLFKFKDRGYRDYAIGFTHEEIVTDLVRRNVRSYKELPMNLYQIQGKGRDEARPRGGVVRGREFIMLDAYSFDRDWDSLDSSYAKMYRAFSRTFALCGLEPLAVEADSGAIGGKTNQEYMVITPAGEDDILVCDTCGYSANSEKCAIGETKIKMSEEKFNALTEVETPDTRTVEQVANFLKVSPKRIIKTLIYKADNKFVAALVRGDRELNEPKLAAAAGVKKVEMVEPETALEVIGAEIGSIGPVGLKKEIKIIADREIAGMANAVVGANKTGYHLMNVNIDRDFSPTIYADIRVAVKGDRCPKCTGKLKVEKGMEVGHIFKLGTVYSDAMNAKFLDDDGKEKVYVMGCYGMGISRMLAAIPEVNNDKDGMILPITVAPFEVTIMLLNPEIDDQCVAATRVYEELTDKGVDVLLDDRDERPGVKFKDNDLMGTPIQVVAGRRCAEGKVEIRVRGTEKKEEVALDDATEYVMKLRDEMFAALRDKANKF